MQNPLSELPVIEANWFETLKEAKDFIFQHSSGLESINPDTQNIIIAGNTKFVEALAFVNLKKMIKIEWIINVNNGIYDVVETQKPIVLFYEYCKWGCLEKYKEILQHSHNPKFLAAGFVAAINQDQLEIVKHFLHSNVVFRSALYKSPLYECIFNNSINCFKFLFRYFEPQKELLPYILEQDASEIFYFCIKTPELKEKLFTVTKNDFSRISRLINNDKSKNDLIEYFKINFFSSIAEKV